MFKSVTEQNTPTLKSSAALHNKGVGLCVLTWKGGPQDIVEFLKHKSNAVNIITVDLEETFLYINTYIHIDINAQRKV